MPDSTLQLGLRIGLAGTMRNQPFEGAKTLLSKRVVARIRLVYNPQLRPRSSMDRVTDFESGGDSPRLPDKTPQNMPRCSLTVAYG